MATKGIRNPSEPSTQGWVIFYGLTIGSKQLMQQMLQQTLMIRILS
ncbi:hypothetical protein ACIQ34_11525 [Ureibacillus sp. NPDC094379]